MTVVDAFVVAIVLGISVLIAVRVWKLLLEDGRLTFYAVQHEVMYGRRSLLVTGPGGSGKSRIIAKLKAKRKNLAVLAPTAIAAHSIKGRTIHSYFKFPIDDSLSDQIHPNSIVRDIVQHIDTVVIDEISMVRVDLIDAIDRALRRYRSMPDVPFGGIRVLLFGDPYQLPPVSNDVVAKKLQERYSAETYKFHDAPVFRQLPLLHMKLVKVWRQREARFIEALNNVRVGTSVVDDLDYLNSKVTSTSSVLNESNVVSIAFTNAKVDAYNTQRLNQLEGEEIVSKAELHGNVDMVQVPCEDVVNFKVGAQVIFINNDSDKRWFNGSVGQILRADENTVTVRLDDGKTLDVSKIPFPVLDHTRTENGVESKEIGKAVQFPFKLGWSLTAHKAQGQTYSRVHIDIDGSSPFSSGQMYVALSRCSSLAGLTISREIAAHEIRADLSSEEFLQSLEAYQNATPEIALKWLTSRIAKQNAYKNSA